MDVAQRKFEACQFQHYIVRVPNNLREQSVELLKNNLEQLDDSFFGLNTIWLRDFHEIPDLLNRISNFDEQF